MRLKIVFILVTSCLVFACQNDRAKLPTASDNVLVLEQEFAIPELERKRKIRIYLPPDYQSSTQRYPVLYMHDGQNLFDDATSYAGEWGIDESLNQLYQLEKLSIIVVGIDNGGEKRMNELSPWKNQDFGAAEGEAYMRFIVNVIKPYVDENYRTLSDVPNTAIMGSSMGGLISHFAIFAYPHIFSKAGIFSPSYWYSEKVYSFSQISNLNAKSRLYLLMGENEGKQMVNNFNSMITQLKANGLDEENLKWLVVKDGEHNEAFWRSEFPNAITWLFR